MEINFYNQPKDGNFLDVLCNSLNSNEYVKAYFYAGFVKDSAIDLLYDSISKAVENGMKIECVFGLDKKNTSKEMLLKLVNLGIKIRYYLNDVDVKLETRLYIFESEQGVSKVYIPSGKLSEGGITTNIMLVEEIKLTPEDKIMLGKIKAAAENGITTDDFKLLTEQELKELASRGDIVARITERKIPSISELYNKDDVTVGASQYDEEASVDYSKLLEKELDFDIDVEEDVKYQTSLGEEVEHKIKNSNSQSEEKVITKIVVPEKNTNFENVSTLIVPLGAKVNSGESQKEVRIPSAFISSLSDFFGYPEDFHVEQDDKGSIKEIKSIELEIFENVSGYQETDANSFIILGAKSSCIKSEMFANITIEDEDLLRLIKIDKNKYRFETIKKGTGEYDVWSAFCTNTTKGTTKKFGVL